MANPHHRAKHKQYLHNKHATAQQHLHRERVTTESKKKTATLLAIIGGVMGFIVAYFVNQSYSALLIGLIAGAAVGYFLGNSIDKSITKKK